MICDNCGRSNANIKYTQIINGETKKLHLCEECAKKLGITDMDFSIPVDFSSFFGNLLEDIGANTLIPEFNIMQNIKCNNCGTTYEQFMRTGKFGCANCYDVFQETIDPILKNIQGSNRHIGRIGEIQENLEEANPQKIEESPVIKEEEQEIANKQEELKQAIKEERYEDAAKIREKIKELEEKNKKQEGE